MKLGSAPEIFIDPVLAGYQPPPKRRKGLHAPPPPAINHAKIAKELFLQLVSKEGWPQFVLHCGDAKALSSTPGWEDYSSPPKQTHPGAKPISDAQWGAAIATVVTLLGAVEGLAFPIPSIDPLGLIGMEWDVGAATFQLEFHQGLIQQTYKWRRVLDGMPREHESSSIDDVIHALKDFLRSAAVK